MFEQMDRQASSDKTPTTRRGCLSHYAGPLTDEDDRRAKPGVDFFLHGARGVKSEYGFRSYSASDGLK